jgi:hypothetical protein
MAKKVKQHQKKTQDFDRAETTSLSEDSLRQGIIESRDAVLELISKIDKKGVQHSLNELDLLAARLEIVALRVERFNLMFDSNMPTI